MQSTLNVVIKGEVLAIFAKVGQIIGNADILPRIISATKHGITRSPALKPPKSNSSITIREFEMETTN